MPVRGAHIDRKHQNKSSHRDLENVRGRPLIYLWGLKITTDYGQQIKDTAKATRPLTQLICSRDRTHSFDPDRRFGDPVVGRCPMGGSRCHRDLLALPGAVARAVLGGTVARLGQFSIGPNTGLRVHAPEQAVVTGLHVGIRLRSDELSLPPQRRTQVRAVRIEALAFPDHAAPPAAFRMARFTETRANWTL